MSSNPLKVIEFACSHNHGRSPLAEAFAKNYLRMNRISGFEVKSTGTHVDFINDQLAGNEPHSYGDLLFLIEAAKKRNLSMPGSDIQVWARDLTNRFVDEEHEYRAKTAEAFFLDVPHNDHKQTFHDPCTVIAFGMGAKNVGALGEIYPRQKTHGPAVYSLSSYVAGRRVPDFQSAFGGTMHDYATMARTISDLTDKALDRFFKKSN